MSDLVTVEPSATQPTDVTVHAALTGTSAHGATTTNTASRGVVRDASGNILVGTVNGVTLEAAIAGTGAGVGLPEPTGGGASVVTLRAPALAGNATVTLPAVTRDLGTDGASLDAVVGAPVVTTTATSAFSGEANLGALTTGLLKITVAAGVATLSTAVAQTDYQQPFTPVAVSSSPKTVAASDVVLVLKTTATVNLPAASTARLLVIICDATSTGTIHPDGTDTVYGATGDLTALPGDGAIFATTGNGDWVWL